MKIECVKDRLAAVISKAEKITGKNLTLPVLACILLEASKNSLYIRATNLDLGIEVEIPAKVIKEGKIAVPGMVLNNFLSNVGNEKNITLEVVENNLHVSTEKSSTKIKSLNFDDFPTIPRIQGEKKFLINSKDFIKGLKSVWYSSSVSSMKPELSSVYVYPEDGSLIFVATDSFRLAEKKISLKKQYEFGNILIPFRNVQEIIRIVEENMGETEICMGKNQISFEFDGIYLTSRIVDGSFPDYRQIIPKEFATEAVLLKQDLISALKLANIFSDKFNKISIKVVPKDKFEVATKNADIGETRNTIDATVTGEGIESSFNFKYINDCLGYIDRDSVTFFFNGSNKPLVVRGVGDQSFTYLVMPMNK